MPSDPNDPLTTLWHDAFADTLQSHYGADLLRLVQSRRKEGTPLEMLPDVVCQSLGGPLAAVAPLTMAWRLIYLAAKLFDDIQDGDSTLPLASGINQGLGVLWTAHYFLENDATGWSPAVRLQLLGRLHPHLLRANTGQEEDIRLASHLPPTYTPDEWSAIASAKSGDLLSWATWSAAWLLTQKEAVADAFATFGQHLGILLQALDDFEGIWGKKGNDITHIALSLPLSYAYMVADTETQNTLTHLLQQARAGSTDAVAETRTLLATVGAREFMWAVAQSHAKAAYGAMVECEGVQLHPIITFLKTIFPPFDEVAYNVADK